MKAILVIDMPKDCWDCPCNWGDVMCNMEKGVEHDLPDKGRLENCPLRPLPQREPEYFTSNGEEVHDVYFQGWNACLDEILGGRREDGTN